MRLTSKVGVLAAALASAVALAACGTSSGASGVSSGTSAAAQPTTRAVVLASGAPSSSRPAPGRSAQPGRQHRKRQGTPAAGAARTGGATTAPATTAPRTPSPAAPAVSAVHPDHVIGHGTPASCTSQAVVRAVGAGGVITFSCGPRPVTIVMKATAKVRNTSARVVLDGGGKVTLSGGGVRRILYMDTCDPAQVWTTSHCQDQSSPVLVVRNMTFADGNSAGQLFDGGGGGAIFDRGGQLKVTGSHFTGNRCDASGPDLGGAAIRALSQYQNRPVYVTGSTFTGGVCSNGGALSSIGVSWVIQGSTMTGNRAIGRGANPAQAGTPGGGSGGAIYTDGNSYTVTIDGTTITGNSATEGGGAVFFVSNDRTGTLRIEHSRLRDNPNAGFHTAGYPGVFFLGRGAPVVVASTLS
jgi:hypothetical protein